MPTVPRTLDIARVSQFLASHDVSIQQITRGGAVNEKLPIILYIERMCIQWIYEEDNEYDGLQAAADYLYALCGQYIWAAIAILDGGGGGTIAPVTPTDDCCHSIYPIYITTDDLDEDGNYDNSSIVGDNVIVFFQDTDEKWHRASADWFSYTENGIRITAAYDEGYSWIIQKLGASESTAETPSVVNYNLAENDSLIENITLSSDGQMVTIAIVPNGFTYCFDTNFIFGDTPALQTPNGENTIQLFTFQYIAAANKLLCVAQSLNIPHS